MEPGVSCGLFVLKEVGNLLEDKFFWIYLENYSWIQKGVN